MTRNLPGLLLFAFALLPASGCKRTSPPPMSQPGQMWRDQILFFPDAPTDPIVVLVVQRDGAGTIEVKGWLSTEASPTEANVRPRDARWRGLIYETARLDRGAASSLTASLEDFNDRPHTTPLRLTATRTPTTLTAELRTATRRVRLTSDDLHQAREVHDPEGHLIWSIGHAQLATDDHTIPGVLITEETPTNTPLHTDVDYGDFLFAAARLEGGAVVITRHAKDRPNFDHEVRLPPDSRNTPTEHPNPQVVLDQSTLNLGTTHLTIQDRLSSNGTTPTGAPRTYEVLLLGGQGRGLAFHIAPAPPQPTKPH